MEVRGVLDRIEDGGMAVILVEEEDFQFTVPVKDLPKGSKVGMHFMCSFGEKEITLVPLDKKFINFKRQQAQKLLEKLRESSNRGNP